ncbi:MAG: response regulator [Cryomorphaceae bacterium]|nr:response regulator [Cryomorphaceae bacterium]
MSKDVNRYELLVVEDNPGDLLLLKDFLDEKFLMVKIHEAINFSEAEVLLKKNFQLSAIILDLNLPDLSGSDLIEMIQLYSNQTPIIVLTGYSDLEVAKAFLQRGVSDFLLKDEMNPTLLYKSIIYSLQRRKYIEDLQNSQQLYSNLFSLSPQPMWLYGIEDLKFLDVNNAAVARYGYTKQEFLSMTIKDIRPKEEVPELEKTLLKSQKVKNREFSGIFTHQTKSGEILKVEVFSNFIIHKNKPVRIILANDITEKLKYLEAIEEQNKKLRSIAWTQSHVIRAPLSRIMGIIQLIELEGEKCADLMDLLKSVVESAKELDIVVEEIANKSQSVDPENLWGEKIKTLEKPDQNMAAEDPPTYFDDKM